jgi:Domain of unknown function (DUF1707)
LLREHYAAGRLSLDELRRRAGIVLSAGYADEAAAVLADLPGGSVGLGGGVPAGKAGRRSGWLARKGHAQTHKPEPGWVSTSERFRDPSSGVIMRVWIDPSDQSRHYIPDDTLS